MKGREEGYTKAPPPVGVLLPERDVRSVTIGSVGTSTSL